MCLLLSLFFNPSFNSSSVHTYILSIYVSNVSFHISTPIFLLCFRFTFLFTQFNIPLLFVSITLIVVSVSSYKTHLSLRVLHLYIYTFPPVSNQPTFLHFLSPPPPFSIFLSFPSFYHLSIPHSPLSFFLSSPPHCHGSSVVIHCRSAAYSRSTIYHILQSSISYSKTNDNH